MAMDRMRMTMTSLLAGVALLGAGAAGAQGRNDLAVTLRSRAQQANQSPEAQAQQLTEKFAWLRRLIGQFHATSDASTMRSPTWSSSTNSFSLPYYSVAPQKQGRAECVPIGNDGEVSCLLDLKPQEGKSVAALRVTLPVAPDETGRAREVDGWLRMGAEQRYTMSWVSLQGNTATFKMECPQRPSRRGNARWASCQQRVIVTARPDGTHVKIAIESGGWQSMVIELTRPRHYTAGKGGALRSDQ
jgi:hypothetical protein